MYQANQCTGFFIKSKKQNLAKYKILYFYVDADGIMHYTHNISFLNFIIKSSNSEREIVTRLRASNIVRQISVQDCRISGIKSFPLVESAPFHQRACFELHVTVQQVVKFFIVFAIIEDDIDILQDYLRGGWQKRKLERDSVTDANHIEIAEKAQLMNKLQEIFEQSKQNPTPENITYTGSTGNNKHGKVFFQEGISYDGEFLDGKKHGRGYIVDSNLDFFYCEFINDDLCGI